MKKGMEEGKKSPLARSGGGVRRAACVFDEDSGPESVRVAPAGHSLGLDAVAEVSALSTHRLLQTTRLCPPMSLLGETFPSC